MAKNELDAEKYRRIAKNELDAEISLIAPLQIPAQACSDARSTRESEVAQLAQQLSEGGDYGDWHC